MQPESFAIEAMQKRDDKPSVEVGKLAIDHTSSNVSHKIPEAYRRLHARRNQTCHPMLTKTKITSLRVIPTVTSYCYIFVTNSDILCAKIWRGREGQDNSDEI